MIDLGRRRMDEEVGAFIVLRHLVSALAADGSRNLQDLALAAFSFC